ncbi:hypothetical protein SKAU_G00346010 [Synaphobranchus kaupii]|uniref:Myb-like domain-containing protein n=1 Tax=Synaphobranchus kaupii TaxID=118154 RepID=A0A9Q1EJI8_SYNKA|nr:hypothetical protein SKAU_G00346010 [Synaphobranchus kaupii]
MYPVQTTDSTLDKSAYHRDGSTSEKRQESRHGDERASSRRERKNFTQEEVQYLLDGVKRLGPCWNSVLWSYPFQKGRTNVDLAKKFTSLAGKFPFKMSQEDAEGSPEA